MTRHTEDRARLRVMFSESGPTTTEVKSLRAIIPALAGRTAASVLASLKDAAELDLGDFESSTARELRLKCQARSLRFSEQGYQVVRLSLINEISNMFLLIEDVATKEAIVQEAIKRGLPVRISTA